MKKRYKIRKEQLEHVVESFVAESNKQAITEKKGLSTKDEDLNEIWPFNKKEKTPKELKDDGMLIASNNGPARNMIGALKKLGKIKTKGDMDKIYMYLGQRGKGGSNTMQVTWKEDLDAPDGTKGFWVDSVSYRGSGNPQGGSFAG
jgi:hypothetical protein